ncbi:hypothetical protein WA026_020677 [Henosepilachna vigintioctopunctata]|uniref:Uncharacterized protein n=1 Tax=Henosepilachna vigintioctopunctata TaxID=420089 RepID=A0AAW1UBQ0_9CUCU
MKKIILDSLHQQKVDPEEAKMIANSLIAEIELEIQKTESFKEEFGTRSDPVFCPNQQVNNYLKELADAKGLDQREVELVESILERRQKQISKLSRGDTQASSMEITDEDLRYSEGDTDYTHVLEQQIDQLKAEYSDKLKTDYDSLVEDQNEISAKSDGAPVEHLEMKYGVDEYQTVKKDSATILENQMKNVIIEEDENVSESIVEDTRVCSPSHTQKDIHSTESISDEYKKLASEGELNHRIVTRSDEENVEVLKKIESTPEKPHGSLISTDIPEVDEIDLELTSKDNMTWR